MRILCILGVLVLAGLGFTGSALAKPIKVTSQNFEFYGDASEKRAVELVEGLESYRAILMSIYGIDPGPEYIPVKIFGFKTQERFEEIIGGQNFNGLYVTGLEGPAFMLSTEGGLRQGKPAWNIAFHEYTHHVLASFTTKHYPRWYNEGLAEYLSTFEIDDDGEFKIGLPSNGRAWTLANYDWMPLGVLIRSVHDYPFRATGGKSDERKQSLFYAQSWLAVHFVQSKPEYSKKLDEYFDRLNQPDAPNNIFEDIMGVPMDQFQSQLKDYYDDNKYSYVKARLTNGITIPPVSAHRISKAELKLRQAEALRLMVRTEAAQALASDYLADAEADLGETVEILLSKAMLAIGERDPQAAKTYAMEALDMAPDSGLANRVYGVALLESYKLYGSQYGSAYEARDYFRNALMANGNDALSHYYYAYSFKAVSERPDKQAIASAQTALDYYRSLNFMGQNIEMAEILANGGDYASAIQVLEKAQVWSQNAMSRDFADRKLEELRSRQQP